MKTIQIEIPEPPEGYVYDGYRKAKGGDYHIGATGEWKRWMWDYSSTYIFPCAVKSKKSKKTVNKRAELKKEIKMLTTANGIFMHNRVADVLCKIVDL